jgi:hypothetical protein
MELDLWCSAFVLSLLFKASETWIRELVLPANIYDVFWLDVGMPTSWCQFGLKYEISYPHTR